jgi:hypothetical protein
MKTTRRELLRLAAAAGVSAMFPWQRLYAQAQSPALRKFIQMLPGLGPAGIPVASATPYLGADYYQLVAGEYTQQQHPLLPHPTRLWGYADAATGGGIRVSHPARADTRGRAGCGFVCIRAGDGQPLARYLSTKTRQPNQSSSLVSGNRPRCSRNGPPLECRSSPADHAARCRKSGDGIAWNLATEDLASRLRYFIPAERKAEMSATTYSVLSGVGRFFEHAAFVLVGLIMMIVGLALGTTIMMLPLGFVIGMLGVAAFVGGIFGRIDQ